MIDHEYTKDVVCPYCGYAYDNWENINEAEDMEWEICGRCEKRYEKYTHITIEYTTKKILFDDFVKDIEKTFKNLLYWYDTNMKDESMQIFRSTYKNRGREYILEMSVLFNGDISMDDLNFIVDDIEIYEEKKSSGYIDRKVRILESGIKKIEKVYNKEILGME